MYSKVIEKILPYSEPKDNYNPKLLFSFMFENGTFVKPSLAISPRNLEN